MSKKRNIEETKLIIDLSSLKKGKEEENMIVQENEKNENGEEKKTKKEESGLRGLFESKESKVVNGLLSCLDQIDLRNLLVCCKGMNKWIKDNVTKEEWEKRIIVSRYWLPRLCDSEIALVHISFICMNKGYFVAANDWFKFANEQMIKKNAKKITGNEMETTTTTTTTTSSTTTSISSTSTSTTISTSSSCTTTTTSSKIESDISTRDKKEIDELNYTKIAREITCQQIDKNKILCYKFEKYLEIYLFGRKIVKDPRCLTSVNSNRKLKLDFEKERRYQICILTNLFKNFIGLMTNQGSKKWLKTLSDNISTIELFKVAYGSANESVKTEEDISIYIDNSSINGNTEIVKYLYEKMKVKRSLRAPKLAARNGQLETLKYLLSNDPKIKLSILIKSAANGNQKNTLNYLIEMYLKTSNGSTILKELKDENSETTEKGIKINKQIEEIIKNYNSNVVAFL